MTSVSEVMESSRALAKGTLPLRVLFESEEEVSEAKAWMKGKKNVKNLQPMTHEEADKLRSIPVKPKKSRKKK